MVDSIATTQRQRREDTCDTHRLRRSPRATERGDRDDSAATTSRDNAGRARRRRHTRRDGSSANARERTAHGADAATVPLRVTRPGTRARARAGRGSAVVVLAVVDDVARLVVHATDSRSTPLHTRVTPRQQQHSTHNHHSAQTHRPISLVNVTTARHDTGSTAARPLAPAPGPPCPRDRPTVFAADLRPPSSQRRRCTDATHT